MQMHSSDTDVLIVGAGPSGLMMACQLALRNIAFRIIDKKDRYTNYSGALILQARSIEILQQMGIAHKAIGEGIFANEIRLIFSGKKSFMLPMKNFAPELTRFPGLLMVEQSVTEQLLIGFIQDYGLSVERGVVLEQFSQDSDRVTSVLISAAGAVEIIRTKYLIGADGAHSTVRKQLQIPFTGKSWPISLFVTDCKAHVEIPPDQMCFSFSASATTGFFPLRGNRWRIDGVIPGDHDLKKGLTFNDISEGFSERTCVNATLSEPEWFSVFRQHDRYAEKFQADRCFLMGDAAHIHSPVGAQGMNTGLQDAYNLAWKLALVIQKKVIPSILDSYSIERVLVARRVVRATGQVFNLMTSRSFPVTVFRIYALPAILYLLFRLMLKTKGLRHFFFRRISQIGINYRQSFLSRQATRGKFPFHAPKPGERLPYILYNEQDKVVNIQEKIGGNDFHLFIFSKQVLPGKILKVAEKYTGLTSIESIPFTEGTSIVYQRLGIKNDGVYLIRPDLYIAYRSVLPDSEHFENYLRKFAERKP